MAICIIYRRNLVRKPRFAKEKYVWKVNSFKISVQVFRNFFLVFPKFLKIFFGFFLYSLKYGWEEGGWCLNCPLRHKKEPEKQENPHLGDNQKSRLKIWRCCGTWGGFPWYSICWLLIDDWFIENRNLIEPSAEWRLRVLGPGLDGPSLSEKKIGI